ncbi:nitronate monooxygenase [Pseudaminobacter sp. 19-2017]|uniref:Nitronate monooxygenase n=1 Tax=Pseudaminobacter soli (ex Zhang et al. 2022) TaxID=2831468 RepID=A0A942E2Y9_9HYPH|nr:nitronate monooxygenase family protein [Pseudaminobacter soli]MBS3651997.1 nitronate monooxygenase [Pseudaminobacter soli]
MNYWTPHGKRLALPLVCAPMFIVSGPELLLAQCKAGVVGSMPALNARTPEVLDAYLSRIRNELAAYDAEHPDLPSAPYAVNLIVHGSNRLLDEQVALCVRHEVPVIITSLGAKPHVNDAIHSYGGIVLHDVVNLVHARKAIERGADGLIAVAAGAGGHAGSLSPFALVQEIREWWAGPLLLSGAISSGHALLAAQVMGADLGYCGSCFIPATEANADAAYKQMVIDSSAADIVYTDKVSGTPANFLRASLERAGVKFDGERPQADYGDLLGNSKAWRDIWSAGHGVGALHHQQSVAEIVAAFTAQYRFGLANTRRLHEVVEREGYASANTQ